MYSKCKRAGLTVYFNKTCINFLFYSKIIISRSPLCAVRALIATCLEHLLSFITVSVATFSSPFSLSSSSSGTTSTLDSSFFSVTVFNFSPSLLNFQLLLMLIFFYDFQMWVLRK